MNRQLGVLAIALAVPPAYAAFVYGWKLADVLSFVTRRGGDLLPIGWAQVVLTGLQMVVIGGALAMCWQFATLGRRRAAVVAMAVAWLTAAPLYALLLFARPL